MLGPRLKRCPFDGGATAYTVERTTYTNGASVRHEINCRVCGASMSKFDYHVGDVSLKKDATARRELVKRWNSRK